MRLYTQKNKERNRERNAQKDREREVHKQYVDLKQSLQTPNHSIPTSDMPPEKKTTLSHTYFHFSFLRLFSFMSHVYYNVHKFGHFV